jgi:pimeloyl-ACP methyl ester carboxylesterase
MISTVLASAVLAGCGGGGSSHSDSAAEPDPIEKTFLKIGTGAKKVLCLHGWFGYAGGWGPFVNYLDLENFTYVFMDYRGYGQRKGSGGPYTIETIADDALAIADYLEWDTFSLIGHSMGGLAIQQVLVKAPERVEKLIGISPVPAGGVPFPDFVYKMFASAPENRDARLAIMNDSTGGAPNVDYETDPPTIIDAIAGSRMPTAWLEAMVQSSLDHSDLEAYAGYLTAWANKSDTTTDIVSLVDDVQGKTLPVLVIAGEYDGGISETLCQNTWMTYYPNARLEVMANAGHYAMDETPLALATMVEKFLLE